MGPTSTSEPQGSSTRPYLIRALHDWCTDNGFTPYIAVCVDASVRVPTEYVKNGEIVLNVGFEATGGLRIGNDVIEFKARFGGVARDIRVPVDHVIAIYARENGQGMAFPMPTEATGGADGESVARNGEHGATALGGGLRLATTSDGEGASASPTPAPLHVAGGVLTPDSDDPPPPSTGGRPALKRVK